MNTPMTPPQPPLRSPGLPPRPLPPRPPEIEAELARLKPEGLPPRTGPLRSGRYLCRLRVDRLQRLQQLRRFLPAPQSHRPGPHLHHQRHSMKLMRLFPAAGSLLLGLAALAHASLIAIDPIEDRFLAGIGAGSAMVGWSFMANADITVTSLGYYSSYWESHPVGVWHNGGALLGSGTVLTSDPSIDGFRYTSVAPISLLAGQTYVIAGFQTSAEDFLSLNAGYSSFSAAPEISYIGHRFPSTPDFERPDVTTIFFDDGLFGPNFVFEAVPEPGTATLVGLALVGVCLRRRRSAHLFGNALARETPFAGFDPDPSSGPHSQDRAL